MFKKKLAPHFIYITNVQKEKLFCDDNEDHYQDLNTKDVLYGHCIVGPIKESL